MPLYFSVFTNIYYDLHVSVEPVEGTWMTLDRWTLDTWLHRWTDNFPVEMWIKTDYVCTTASNRKRRRRTLTDTTERVQIVQISHVSFPEPAGHLLSVSYLVFTNKFQLIIYITSSFKTYCTIKFLARSVATSDVGQKIKWQNRTHQIPVTKNAGQHLRWYTVSG